MRFLMVCMQFPIAPGQSYMTTELADALVDAGHQVEVLLIDWSAPSGGETEIVSTPSGIRVVRCAPRAAGRNGSTAWKAAKFLLTGRHIARIARRHFTLEGFDAVIAWMPAVAIAPLLPLIRRARIRHRLLFIWDFFPFHHREIGRIPGGVPFWAARAWEQRLMGQFTAIICNMPGNADYLRRHYAVDSRQRVMVTPIWSDTSQLPVSDRSSVRLRHGLPLDRPIAVFGGQLAEGRGFEQMLAAADTGLAAGSPLTYLFVGGGRLAPTLSDRSERQPNIICLPPLSRAEFLELLGACDVGLIATVPGVTSYCSPTKTIDYLRAGLPVVAALERGNDFIGLIERYRVGQAVPFGEPALFQREAERLATDPRARTAAREGARRCLDDVFDVRHAVHTVVSAADDLPQMIEMGSRPWRSW